jgi:hypothetical protein
MSNSISKNGISKTKTNNIIDNNDDLNRGDYLNYLFICNKLSRRLTGDKVEKSQRKK